MLGLFTRSSAVRLGPALARSYSSAASRVGFIGLGNMGGHMASNLVKNGFDVVVFDLNKDSVNRLEKAGAKSAPTVAEVAAQAETVITMLPSSPHVIDVYTGERGVIKHAKKGALLIDASTIDPTVARNVCKEATERGLGFVDAPVSGGVGGAEAGTLTFMVGGKENQFQDAQHYLRAMGKNIVHCGDVGTGQVAKICNNMLLGISMVGVAEAMNLGLQLGIDKHVLAGIINTSSGRCWSSDTYNPVPGVMENVPSSRGYQGGFGCALMLKDLGLATQAASNAKAPVPLGSLAEQLYTVMCQHGYSAKDFGAIFDYLHKKPQ